MNDIGDKCIATFEYNKLMNEILGAKMKSIKSFEESDISEFTTNTASKTFFKFFYWSKLPSMTDYKISQYFNPFSALSQCQVFLQT